MMSSQQPPKRLPKMLGGTSPAKRGLAGLEFTMESPFGQAGRNFLLVQLIPKNDENYK